MIRGASAIVDSFRLSHEIDDQASPTEIIFIDVLRSQGDELEIRHRMRLSISANGLIAELRFVRPHGERAVLDDFFRRQGLLRALSFAEWRGRGKSAWK